MTELSSKSYFPALTGLRFLAAVMVLLFHYERGNPAFPELVRRLIAELYIGVSLFFVLSGFLIAHRYLLYHPGKHRATLAQYFLNRFARIYPLFFILSALTFCVHLFLPAYEFDAGFRTFLFEISFLKGFSKEYYLAGIPQSWSLSVEELFYLLAPLFFFLIRKSRGWIIALPVLMVLVGLSLVRLFSFHPFMGFFEDTSFMLTFTFFGRSVEFFAGIGIALMVQRKGRTKVSFTWLGLLGICLSILFLNGLKGDLEFGFLQPIGLAIHNLALPVLGFGPFIYGLVTEKTWLSRFLSGDLMQLLGKSSYALYLLHLGIFQSLLGRVSGNTLFVFPAMVLLSVLFFKVIEDPINRFLRKSISTFSEKG